MMAEGRVTALCIGSRYTPALLLQCLSDLDTEPTANIIQSKNRGHTNMNPKMQNQNAILILCLPLSASCRHLPALCVRGARSFDRAT